MTPLEQFAKDMTEHDCTYGDNCPIFGSNHGRCIGCQARTALEESKINKITELRQAVSKARDDFANSRNGSKSDYELAFGRLMKAINRFNEARSYKIKELGLDTF